MAVYEEGDADTLRAILKESYFRPVWVKISLVAISINIGNAFSRTGTTDAYKSLYKGLAWSIGLGAPAFVLAFAGYRFFDPVNVPLGVVCPIVISLVSVTLSMYFIVQR